MDVERNKFLRLLHGGSEVDAAQYAATDGGTVITLSEPYLRTFANGSYTFRTEFTDGYTDLTLTVAIEASAPPSSPQPDDVPKTGDDSHGDIWTMLLVVSGLCMAGIALWYRWRQRKESRA